MAAHAQKARVPETTRLRATVLRFSPPAARWILGGCWWLCLLSVGSASSVTLISIPAPAGENAEAVVWEKRLVKTRSSLSCIAKQWLTLRRPEGQGQVFEALPTVAVVETLFPSAQGPG